MVEAVNHPKHYNNHPSGIEAIEIMRPMHCDLANAVKYLWRAGEKGPLNEDLAKARWYLRDLSTKVQRHEPVLVLPSQGAPWVKNCRKVVDALKDHREPHHRCVWKICHALDMADPRCYSTTNNPDYYSVYLGSVAEAISYCTGILDGALGI